jgi:hypothetical protein
MEPLRVLFAAAVCVGAGCTLLVSTDDLTGGAIPLDAAAEEADAPHDSPSIDAPLRDAPQPPPDAGCALDVSADPSNCGACGHTCGGGACANGSCQPIAVSASPGTVFDLAVDDTNLYYTINQPPPDGVVGRIPKNGGNPTAFVAGLDSAQRVKVQGDQVHFVSYDGTWTLKACDKLKVCSPATATPIVQAGYIPDFQESGSTLYFVDWNVGHVLTCAIGSCATPTVLTTGELRPWSVALDGAHVYWSAIADDLVGGGTIRGCPLQGCGAGPATFRSGLTSPLSIAADSTHLYWASRSGSPDAGGVSVVGSCTSATCTSSSADFSIPRLGAGGATRLTVDARDVIWGDTGMVLRCPVPSCAGGARTVATTRDGPQAVTADPGFIYWADSAGVWRIAR